MTSESRAPLCPFSDRCLCCDAPEGSTCTCASALLLCCQRCEVHCTCRVVQVPAGAGAFRPEAGRVCEACGLPAILGCDCG